MPAEHKLISTSRLDTIRKSNTQREKKKFRRTLNILWALHVQVFVCALPCGQIMAHSETKFRLFTLVDHFIFLEFVLLCSVAIFFVKTFYAQKKHVMLTLFYFVCDATLFFFLPPSLQHLGVSDKMSVNLLVFAMKWNGFCVSPSPSLLLRKKDSRMS